MDCKQRDMLLKIQELEFTALDLNLFLDTHPDDMDALMEYNRCVVEIDNAKKVYEMKYGPLTNFGYAPSQYPWKWIEEPWPWQTI